MTCYHGNYDSHLCLFTSQNDSKKVTLEIEIFCFYLFTFYQPTKVQNRQEQMLNTVSRLVYGMPHGLNGFMISFSLIHLL